MALIEDPIGNFIDDSVCKTQQICLFRSSYWT